MRMIVEQLVEWRLAGETEVLGEKLPQRHCVHHNSHMTRPRARTPGRRGGKPATNRLSYGAANTKILIAPDIFQTMQICILLTIQFVYITISVTLK
jgi:hypothetical protein